VVNNKLVNYFRNYKNKSKLSIASDFVFVLFIVLMIIPSTRIEVASFVIRLTSLSPSELEKDQQFTLSESDKLWQVTDMQGNKHVLQALMNEKPVFINFWATWCPPCVAEMPGIADLYEKYGDRVSFIIATNESSHTVNTFAEKRQYTSLPFYQYRSVPNVFQTESIPATFLVSKSGRVVISKKGAAHWNSDGMNQIIDQLLAE